LNVGAGKEYSRISDAVAASHDGDTLQVQAGTYLNDFTTINTKITIEGVGGMVHLLATQPPPDGKAILTTNTDVTLDHLEFSGAQVPDMNGAGVRYQGGNLTITNSYFHDNQDGLLAGAVLAGSITIRTSEFAHNGAGDGSTHNLYVGDVGSLVIDRSYFHDAVVGHEIKSRAERTTITNSRIQDGPSGTASGTAKFRPTGGLPPTTTTARRGLSRRASPQMSAPRMLLQPPSPAAMSEGRSTSTPMVGNPPTIGLISTAATPDSAPPTAQARTSRSPGLGCLQRSSAAPPAASMTRLISSAGIRSSNMQRGDKCST